MSYAAMFIIPIALIVDSPSLWRLRRYRASMSEL